MTNSFRRERLLIISNISVMAVTFIVLGLFISLFAFSQTALKTLEKQAQITLFFKDEFTEENILALKGELEKDTRIAEINYISKEGAFKIFTELNKDDPVILESVSASILPASLEIKTKNIEDLAVFAEELNKLDGVEDVKFFRDVIERFRHWSNIAYTVGLVLVAVFLVISFSVIMITLRISINSKGKELEILKLVGASDSYVKKPLIKQGIFFGLTSSLIASAILSLFFLSLQLSGIFSGYIEFVFLPDFLINLTVFSISLSVIIIASGLALGYLGSLTAIKKYLKY